MFPNVNTMMVEGGRLTINKKGDAAKLTHASSSCSLAKRAQIRTVSSFCQMSKLSGTSPIPVVRIPPMAKTPDKESLKERAKELDRKKRREAYQRQKEYRHQQREEEKARKAEEKRREREQKK